LTPVKSISGLPFDGPSYSVKVEPEGLFFYVFATLTITPLQRIPVDEQLFFQFSDDGKTLDPALPVLASAEPKILVGHFSGFGISRTNSADRAAFLRQQSTDAERNIQRAFIEQVTWKRQRRQAGLDAGSGPELEAIVNEFKKQVIKPLLQAAANCDEGENVMRKIAGFERQKQMAGIESQSVFDDPEYTPYFNALYARCEEEAIRKCKAKKDPSILMIFWMSYARQTQLAGAAAGASDFSGMVNKARRICLPHSYTATGGGSKMKMSGTICDLGKPFQLTAIGHNGVTYQYSFRPGGPTFGGLSYTGSSGGCTESGTGTYTVALSEDAATGTVTYTVSGNVTCQGVGGNFSGSLSFTLDEAPPC
jgi:hypothetical protein